MTAGVAVPPEHPTQQTHLDRGDGGSADGGGKSGLGGGSSTGRDNGRQCQWQLLLPLLSFWGTRQQGCTGNRLWHHRWQGQQGNRHQHNK